MSNKSLTFVSVIRDTRNIPIREGDYVTVVQTICASVERNTTHIVFSITPDCFYLETYIIGMGLVAICLDNQLSTHFKVERLEEIELITN